MVKITPKAKKFNKILVAAKQALDSINIPFHLHFGTALGAHREKSFIEHDDDIDIAVFYKDVNQPSQVREIKRAMEDAGFTIEATLGKIDDNFEIQFSMDDIGFDIFWMYEGKYRGKKYFITSSYYGACDNYPRKRCIWGYRPYKPVTLDFLGHSYQAIPTKTLVDSYGEDWKIPKVFGYHEGLESGYKSLLADYYKPRPTNNKIAFCFLLYDTHKHSQSWIKFFNSDKYPIKNYNIYTHLKEINKNTQDWLVDHKIQSIKTGWCEENLVYAWIKLLQKALKDPDNKYFVILSGECIPLYDFSTTYKKITSTKKSRINIDKNAEATFDTGLAYADQWVVLNRKHAKELVKLKTTKEGKDFRKSIKKTICTDDVCFCPDELYPANWFIYKYGKPSSKTFRKQFKIQQTTYTKWDGIKPNPIKFTSVKLKRYKKSICKSPAFFARKFNSKAGKLLAMNCK